MANVTMLKVLLEIILVMEGIYAQFIEQPRAGLHIFQVSDRATFSCSVMDNYLVNWIVTFSDGVSIEAADTTRISIFEQRNFSLAEVGTRNSSLSFDVGSRASNNETNITCIAQQGLTQVPGNEVRVIFISTPTTTSSGTITTDESLTTMSTSDGTGVVIGIAVGMATLAVILVGVIAIVIVVVVIFFCKKVNVPKKNLQEQPFEEQVSTVKFVGMKSSDANNSPLPAVSIHTSKPSPIMHRPSDSTFKSSDNQPHGASLSPDTEGVFFRSNSYSSYRPSIVCPLDVPSPDLDLYIARHDYIPRKNNRLSFKKGEKMLILSKDGNENLWKGVNAYRKVGLISSSQIVKDEHNKENYSWFHGEISEKETNEVLSTSAKGTFLVRINENRPSKNNTLAVQSGDHVKEYCIHRNPQCDLYGIDNIDVIFKEVSQLVRFFCESPEKLDKTFDGVSLVPFPNYWGRQKEKHLLSTTPPGKLGTK